MGETERPDLTSTDVPAQTIQKFLGLSILIVRGTQYILR